MYCSKCGKEVKETDTFCGFCGAQIQKIENYNNENNVKQEESSNIESKNYQSYENQLNNNDQNNIINQKQNFNGANQNNLNMNNSSKNQFQGNINCGQNFNNQCSSIKFSESLFKRMILQYFKKPLSFFEIMKDEDTTQTSIIMLIVMIILYGLFHMLYFISFFKSFTNKISSVFDGVLGSLLKSSMNSSELASFNDGLDNIQSTVNAYVSNNFSYGEYFLKGMLIFGMLILVTFIIIQICNSMFLKNSISQKNIILIINFAFIPLLLSLILSNIVIYISITATLCVFLFGIIMSLITVFAAMIKLSVNEVKDRTYYSILINSAVFAIITPFIVSMAMSSVFNTLKGILTQLFGELAKF